MKNPFLIIFGKQSVATQSGKGKSKIKQKTERFIGSIVP